MRTLPILAFVLTLPALALAQTGRLNDTGITECHNDSGATTAAVATDTGTHSRQDCRYGRDTAAVAGMPKNGAGSKGFDFTKIANNGTALPADAALGSGPTDWACTRDNVTGLIWEIKTTSGLRSQSHTYTWYDSNPATNGGNAGTESGGSCATSGRCDTEKYVADVNAAGLCGATDWRMPAKKELLSIVDFGRYDPSIDQGHFPNTPASYFWSATVEAGYSRYAWTVSFYSGHALGGSDKVYGSFHVCLLRTSQ
jgi:hypothetical protein